MPVPRATQLIRVFQALKKHNAYVLFSSLFVEVVREGSRDLLKKTEQNFVQFARLKIVH